eukprot:3783505-Alexandrium_andersonii.AAC.1
MGGLVGLVVPKELLRLAVLVAGTAGVLGHGHPLGRGGGLAGVGARLAGPVSVGHPEGVGALAPVTEVVVPSGDGFALLSLIHI